MERGMRRACTWNAACGGSNAHLRRRAPYNPVFRGKAAKNTSRLRRVLLQLFPHPVSQLLSRELRPGDCGRGTAALYFSRNSATIGL